VALGNAAAGLLIPQYAETIMIKSLLLCKVRTADYELELARIITASMVRSSTYHSASIGLGNVILPLFLVMMYTLQALYAWHMKFRSPCRLLNGLTKHECEQEAY